MNEQHDRPAEAEHANELFKKPSKSWLWGFLAAAAAVNLVVFAALRNSESAAPPAAPPPAGAGVEADAADISAAPTFTPRTVDPALINGPEVARALEREYPPLLRDAGVGGVVNLWFFINEEGVVENQVLNQSSGHAALDEAALRIAPIFEFTPALNRDQAVPVWVSIPINFTTS